MIKLYDTDETKFEDNGLGCLNDALTCSIKEGLNDVYELEMTYPLNGIHYSDIALERIIFTKPNLYDKEQAFRIYSISKPINGIVTIDAEHISYDLSGYPVKGALEHYAWYVEDVFDHIRNNSLSEHKFTFESEIEDEKKSISLSCPRSIRSYLGNDENGILNLFGGEWYFDMYKVSLKKQRGEDRGVVIEYGKNLTDVTQEEKCSEMYTGVYPYYYREDDGLQSLDDEFIILIKDAKRTKILPLDLTDSFDEMPTSDELKKKTKEYIEENKIDKPKVSLTVSFIKNPELIDSLQDVRLGDELGVKFIKIGVDSKSRCIKYDFNAITGQYNQIELGEPNGTIVDTVANTSSNLETETSRAKDAEKKIVRTLEDSEKGLRSTISQTAGEIRMEVSNSVNGLDSKIIQNAESIKTKVSNSDFASYQTQTAEKIASKVSNGVFESYKSQTAEAIGSKVSNETYNSYIKQTAEKIASKVESETFKSYQSQTDSAIGSKVSNDTYNSYIEQTAKKIASKVESETFNSYKSQTDSAISSKITKGDAESIIQQKVNSIKTEIKGEIPDYGSRIEQTENDIKTKVSAGDICSTISQSSDTITFSSNRLIINSTNFKLDNSGNVTMKGAVEAISGKIGPFEVTGSSIGYSGGTQIKGDIIQAQVLEGLSTGLVLGNSSYTTNIKGNEIYMWGDTHIQNSLYTTSIKPSGEMTIGSSSNNIKMYGSQIHTYGPFYVHDYGTSTKPANARINDVSDRIGKGADSSKRFKHDIFKVRNADLDPRKLYDLDVCQYKYNLDYLTPDDMRYNKDVIGFIAEDVNRIYPIAAEIDDYGNVENWNERFIIPPMLKLIQEQYEEIQKLKFDVISIKGELDILKQKEE